jgi:hypothetical protein
MPGVDSHHSDRVRSQAHWRRLLACGLTCVPAVRWASGQLSSKRTSLFQSLDLLQNFAFAADTGHEDFINEFHLQVLKTFFKNLH